jgi:hypothetical protein
MNGNHSHLEPLPDGEEARKRRTTIELWQTIGAIKLADKLATSLSSQILRALEQVRDEKKYLAEGYETFDSFLNHHPDSPMSHDAFRRRVNVLKGEGDEAFDLLNALKVPLEQRKLLAGQIEVTDDAVKIAGIETRLDDGPRIIELISKLYSKNLELQRTHERGKKDNEKWKRKALEAEKNAISINPDGTETGQALLTAAGALQKLRDSLAKDSDEAKQAFREPIFELLRNNQLECSIVLGVISKSDVAKRKSDDLDISDDEAQDLLGD